MAGGGGGAVFLAIIGNGILALLKFVAFFFSRSPSMLSEAIHSVADTSNQILLYIGIRRSDRPADRRYHWGYGGERFFFALMSAIGIFVLGCGVTVYHGVAAAMNPPDIKISALTFAVLGAALLIDGFVFLAALREVNRKRKGQPFWQFVKTSSDPTLLAVLFEDFVATVGVLLALAGTLLAHYTGNPLFDAVTSIIIGAMLGFIAIWLGWRNRVLILGPAIPPHIQQAVLDYLLAQDSIDTVRKVRTRIVGSDNFAFAAEIDYHGAFFGKQVEPWLAQALEEGMPVSELAEQVGHKILEAHAAEVDRIEDTLKAKFPRLAHLDLESDDNPDLDD